MTDEVDFIELKRTRAKFGKLIKLAKRKSWNEYVSISTITNEVSEKNVWHKIRKIQGINSSTNISSILDNNNDICTNPETIANVLGKHFEHVCSDENYPTEFMIIKESEEKQLFFNEPDDLDYNKPFSLQEMNFALKSCNNSSPGNDEIHYSMLKNLTLISKKYILRSYNKYWVDHQMPEAWREALVIPILKPKKNKKDPSSYRPISLTNVLYKLFEKMVNNRLLWYLETNNLIYRNQCGFRKSKSTQDSIVMLNEDILKAFNMKQNLAAIFVDLEKAYDTTWKYNILKTLTNMGLRGNIMSFIQNFLTDRKFQVLIGQSKSEKMSTKNGIPQGSILSVTLFLVAINSVVAEVTPDVKILLFADDIVLYHTHKKPDVIEKELQLSITQINR